MLNLRFMGVVQGRLATTWPVVRSVAVALLGLNFSVSISIFTSGMAWIAGIDTEHSIYIHGDSGGYAIYYLCYVHDNGTTLEFRALSLPVH